MTVKIKFNSEFKKLSKLLPAANSKVSIAWKAALIDIIENEYDKSTSPVKGFNPWEKKVDGSKSIMKKSGDMRNTLKATQHKGGKVSLSIGSASIPYARYHQDGTEHMSARPLLPEKRGQKFKKGVMNKILNITRKAIRQVVKKYN